MPTSSKIKQPSLSEAWSEYIRNPNDENLEAYISIRDISEELSLLRKIAAQPDATILNIRAAIDGFCKK